MTPAEQAHKEWLDTEYGAWAAALSDSTVHNFKEHPAVKRMLGDVHASLFPESIPENQLRLLQIIDDFGRGWKTSLSGDALRMIHYARKVLACEPTRIVEIGGGVGQFYVTLRALGYQGTYRIYDLPSVEVFQRKYLAEVESRLGFDLSQQPPFEGGEFCCSFYALGEFNDELKAWYLKEVVSRCPHGLVIWNPHSGASPNIDWPWPCEITDESPLTHDGNKQISW